MGQTVGFKRIHGVVFDKQDTDKVVRKFTWENEKGGTVNMTVSGLAPEKVAMRASNKTVWQKKQGTGEVQSEMGLFNIPNTDLNAVLGREEDDNGTSWIGDDTRAPYVAMIGESEDLITGEPVYCALTRGTMSLDSDEWKTTEEKDEAPEPQKLTGDWIGREIEGKHRQVGYHFGEKGKDAFFNNVLPTYNEGTENPDTDDKTDEKVTP